MTVADMFVLVASCLVGVGLGVGSLRTLALNAALFEEGRFAVAAALQLGRFALLGAVMFGLAQFGAGALAVGAGALLATRAVLLRSWARVA